jgi:hypothetical protein
MAAATSNACGRPDAVILLGDGQRVKQAGTRRSAEIGIVESGVLWRSIYAPRPSDSPPRANPPERRKRKLSRAASLSVAAD